MTEDIQVKCDLRHPSKMWLKTWQVKCDLRHPSKMWLKTSK